MPWTMNIFKLIHGRNEAIKDFVQIDVGLRVDCGVFNATCAV